MFAMGRELVDDNFIYSYIQEVADVLYWAIGQIENDDLEIITYCTYNANYHSYFSERER